MDAASKPAPRSLAQRIWWALAAVALLALIVLSAVYICSFDDHHFTDLDVYLGGGDVWRRGMDLYQAQLATPFPKFTLRFTYPPLAAVLFSGLTLVPVAVAAALFTAGTMAVLLGTMRTVLARVVPSRLLATYPLPVLALAVTLVATWLEPVRETISFGQVNVLLLGLVVADCLVAKPWWPRGLLIGFAAAIKLTPAAFVLFFLARGQWRPALTAVAGFLGFGLVGVLLAPRDSADYWLGALLDTNRVGVLGFSYNQSLRGMIARTGMDSHWETPLWLMLCVAVLVATWLVVGRARAAGEDVAALVAVGTFSLLVSPVSWAHHWVWAAPALVWATARTVRTRSWRLGLLTAFALYLFWFAPYRDPPQLRDPGEYWDFWQSVLGNAYVWLAVLVLGSMTVWTRKLRVRSRPSREPVPQPA